MYQALYRKWRPAHFADVVGQEAITTTLANQIIADKIGHAYLFTGTRGTGKTTCAKLFAKAVNCEDRAGAEPCGKCPPCLGMENGSILDVVEIDAASNNSVDDVRELREETAFRPSRSRFRVYIIDEVHMLSTSAFNALLKILEEPPSHVIFILATTEIHKVPATILSRCQRFDFMRIGAEKIAARLAFVANEEGIELTDEAADLIARLADGALRDALSLLDTCAGAGRAVDEALVRRMAGVADKDYLFKLNDAVLRGDLPAMLGLVAEVRARSIDMRRLCEELVLHYRNYLLALATPDGTLLDNVPLADRQRYLEGAPAVGEELAVAAVRRLTQAVDRMARSPEPRIELELALVDLGEAAGGRKRPSAALPTVDSAGKTPLMPEAVVMTKKTGTATPIPTAVPADENGPPPVVNKETKIASSAVSTQPGNAAGAPVAAFEAPTPEPAQQAAGAVTGDTSGQDDAAGENGSKPFGCWPAVVEKMADTDRMLYSYMKNTRAYHDGKRVLISGGDMFLTYMREYDSAAETIKAVIEQVSGIRYGIGPYKPPAGQEQPGSKTARDTLKEWEKLGVEVSYE